MKTFIYAAAAVALMSGAAMAQDETGSTIGPSSPLSTIVTTDSSTMTTGVGTYNWTTGTPGYQFASPTVRAIPPGTTTTSVDTGAGDIGTGNDSN